MKGLAIDLEKGTLIVLKVLCDRKEALPNRRIFDVVLAILDST